MKVTRDYLKKLIREALHEEGEGRAPNYELGGELVKFSDSKLLGIDATISIAANVAKGIKRDLQPASLQQLEDILSKFEVKDSPDVKQFLDDSVSAYYKNKKKYGI